MRKRIAYASLVTLAAFLALSLNGSATAKPLAAPTITSVSPTSGARGTTVTVTGTNLQNATVTWAVAGNPGAKGSTSGAMKAAPIDVTVSSDGTQLRFSVPAGGDASRGIVAPAGANRFTVTTAGGSVSKLFTVTTLNTIGMKPVITYLMPRRAAPGQQITIFGNHLSGATVVKLAGMKAAFKVPSDTRILAKVPLNARSGKWSVTTGLGTATSPAAFTVARTLVAAKAGATSKTTITVTAGKPSELAFKLSKTSMVKPGTITFKVTNQGVAFHNFRICSKPVASASAVDELLLGQGDGDPAPRRLGDADGHDLEGRHVRVPLHDQRPRRGRHEGAHRRRRRRVRLRGEGRLGGRRVQQHERQLERHHHEQQRQQCGSSSTTTTRPSSGSGGSNTSGCAPGVTIQTSGAADADGDEHGTEPDDNDGCV